MKWKFKFRNCRGLAVFFMALFLAASLFTSCAKTSYLEQKNGKTADAAGKKSGSSKSSDSGTSKAGTKGSKSSGKSAGSASNQSSDKTSDKKTSGSGKTGSSETDTVAGDFWVVQVTGAVKNPGVYQVKADSRVYEAINLAGGLSENAAADSLNQAGYLEDGQMIHVLTREEAASQPELSTSTASSAAGTSGSGSQGTSGNTKVNINRAGKEELMQLPGIGESKAEAILAYRNEHGSFSSVEDLQKISGIKEGVLQKIRDRCTVG